MTVGEIYRSLLKESKKYGIPEIDIRYLICHFQKRDSIANFFVNIDENVKDLQGILDSFEKMKTGFPVAYLINETDFLGTRYFIDNNVLIPRVETEELVGLTIKRISQYLPFKNISLVDVGTGSGVIACELKKNVSNANVFATEISNAALNVAKKNIIEKNLNISTYLGDGLNPLIENKIKVDLIVSNPPYILDEKDCDDDVKKYEPNCALFLKSENDVYEKIFKDYKKVANYPFVMVFEIADNIVDHLKSLMDKYLKDVEFAFVFSEDINKKTRFLTMVINNE